MAASDISLAPPRDKGLLDRVLSVVSEVKAGEGAGALLLAVNVFTLLASYYVLKTVREALILSEAGAEVKSYANAVQAVLFLLIVPAYGAFASRVNRVRLIGWVTAFFMSHIAIFFLLSQSGVKVGVVYFIWVGIFNYLVIAQFWAFANDLYTEEQGKRLFPIVGVGASLGAVLGALATKYVFERIGPYQLMVIAGAMLGFCILLTVISHRRDARHAPTKVSQAEAPLGKEGGFRLIFKQRYLLLIAVLILLLNLVNTTGEFVLGKFVETQAEQVYGEGDAARAERGAFIGRFYGDFFFWVNLVSLAMQMLLVSRIFKFIGVRGALFVLPLISLTGYGMLAFVPILALVRLTKILENATDYSLMNTTRHALFLPTSREAKYKAKAATDTFFVRFGDMLQAGLVFAGTQLAFSIKNFALANVVFVLIWLAVAAAIYREHKRISHVA
ncbi:MAG: MFS transporter [Bryobacteraceae bacterium]|nr:MFS transporter [Bryobacteraceae bacterium]